jgi:hypothetical protein
MHTDPDIKNSNRHHLKYDVLARSARIWASFIDFFAGVKISPAVPFSEHFLSFYFTKFCCGAIFSKKFACGAV